AGETHIFVVDPGGTPDTCGLVDLRPYGVLGAYDEEEDAGRVDPAWVSFNPEGTRIAFTARVWGIEMGGAHEIDHAVAVMDIDGRNLSVIERGVEPTHLGFDTRHFVHYAKNGYLTHSAAETPLEEHMRLGGQSHIAVSDDGIVTGTTVGGKIFVGGRTLDFEPWLDVKVSSDGQRVLATDWNDGLYTFNTETEEKKEVSPPLGGDKNYWVFDMGSTGGPIVYYVGETGGLVHMLRFDEP
ncbi:MAG: hypothetical protein JW834_02300, partial [Candidatus Diapherotrites archaeon]|nr:hypothetical protein [Candidatus Diapherotrites archaeon]